MTDHFPDAIESISQEADFFDQLADEISARPDNDFRAGEASVFHIAANHLRRLVERYAIFAPVPEPPRQPPQFSDGTELHSPAFRDGGDQSRARTEPDDRVGAPRTSDGGLDANARGLVAPVERRPNSVPACVTAPETAIDDHEAE